MSFSCSPDRSGDIDSPEAEVPINKEVSYLKDGYQYLTHTTAENKIRLKAVEDQIAREAAETKTRLSGIEEQLKGLATLLGKQPAELSSAHGGHPPLVSPHSFHPAEGFERRLSVRNPLFEREFEHQAQDVRQGGYRADHFNLANRESMLQKVAMPSFEGINTHDWLVDIEHFFTIGDFQDEDRLTLIPLCLEGRVKKWFAWVMRRGGFRDWRDFRQKLVVRFAESLDEESNTRLFAIKQTGYVADYVSEFEDLSAQVLGLEGSSVTLARVDNAKQRMEAAEEISQAGSVVVSVTELDNLSSQVAGLEQLQMSGGAARTTVHSWAKRVEPVEKFMGQLFATYALELHAAIDEVQPGKVKFRLNSQRDESFVFSSPEKQFHLGNYEPHIAGKEVEDWLYKDGEVDEFDQLPPFTPLRQTLFVFDPGGSEFFVLQA